MSTPGVVNEPVAVPDAPRFDEDRKARMLTVLRWAAIPVGMLIVVWSLFGSTFGSDPGDSTVELAHLGLSVSAEIQAGQSIEITVPIPDDTVVSIGTVPEGVTATLTPATDGTMTLRVAPAADTPRGQYNLGLVAVADGERQELSWPFRVADPDGT